ncbi:MAG: serine/threonine-protein kinase [Planctomycetota bacterium]|nr:serine/threonine-protein kinase [Planctomycetota bacterium]
MTEPTLCPQCRSEIPAGSPAGLCPKCLVLAGLESQPPDDPKLQATQPSPPAASSGFVPPTVQELASRFPQLEIVELLGRGGMGAVYKARQKELDRLVAVKILPAEISCDQAFAERFSREARALARLSHPNIVAVYDFGRTGDGLFYFVMEYVDGVNLRQAIQSGSMSPKEALAIVPQICDALQFAHDEGIVHRDIKPENILVDKRGRVKIADFGLAKLLGQAPSDVCLTGTQQVMGTLRYMAPEQMAGTKTVDHRADIYSLGVVFYELLTGELPIGRFAPPSKKVQIDVRLDEIVLRALEEKPEQRYQHASDVKTGVEAIRDSAPALSPTAWTPTWTAILLRRATVLTLMLITLAEAAFLGLQAGYLAGAGWYFKQELLYNWLSTVWWTLTAGAGACLFWVWYLLAKASDMPPSFADFFCVMRGDPPDPRTKRLSLPAGVFFAVWVVAEVIAMTTLGDAWQAVVGSIPFVVVPYLVLAALWWTYRPQAGAARGQAGPPAEPAVPTAPPVALPQMLAVAVGLVLGMLCATVGLLLVPAAFLSSEVGSGSFWGWLGGAFGCLVGGLGSLAGSWNTCRQLRGKCDLMKLPRWTGLDIALAGYGLLGLLSVVGGILAKAGLLGVLESQAAQSTSYGLLLLGGLMVFQAALFLMLRVPLVFSGASADVASSRQGEPSGAVIAFAGVTSALLLLELLLAMGWRSAHVGRPGQDPPVAESGNVCRTFSTDEPTLSSAVTAMSDGTWSIDCPATKTFHLFEMVFEPDDFEMLEADGKNCLLHYQAKLNAARLQGCAYLEMWCRLPGSGESFSRGLDSAISGPNNQWTQTETPFRLEPGQRPDLIRLNLVVEGQGTVGLKDVELQFPAESGARPVLTAAEVRRRMAKPKMMRLVEFYFRDHPSEPTDGVQITDRETLQWGEVATAANGDRTIRYQFRATGSDAQIRVVTLDFTFDAQDRFASVKEVGTELTRRRSDLPAKGEPSGPSAAGAASTPAPEITATDILRRMGESYAALSTLSASGQVVSEVTPSGGGEATSTKHTFTVNLGRPEYYRITWGVANDPKPTGRDTVWSAGDGHKVMLAGTSGTFPNREAALAIAGIFRGIPRNVLLSLSKDDLLFVRHRTPPAGLQTVPSLFFKDDANGLIQSLKNPILLPDETVGAEACHVVAADRAAEKVTLWITKKGWLLKKIQTKTGPDSHKGTTPEAEELSDESLKKLLKSLGQDPTPEAVNNLRRQKAEARRRAAATPPSTTTSTMIYETVAVNELMIKEDFEFSDSDSSLRPADGSNSPAATGKPSSASPPKSEGSADLSPADARRLIPEAASMTDADFQKLAGGGDEVESPSQVGTLNTRRKSIP